MDDTEVSADAVYEHVRGELVNVVRVGAVDANGHPREFTLTVDDAEHLSAYLRLAAEATA
jgi:hypothetical protein